MNISLIDYLYANLTFTQRIAKHLEKLRKATYNWWAIIPFVIYPHPTRFRLRNGSTKTVSNYRDYADLVTNFQLEEPGRDFRYRANTLSFAYKGKRVFLHYEDMDTRNKATMLAAQNFFEENVDALDVRGRTIIDIGASIGDTAIKFALDGAKKVVAFEPEKHLHKIAGQNVRLNRLGKRIMLVNRAVRKISDLDKYKGDAIKCDIDGGEYDLFLKASDETLSRYSEILLEYHRGYKDLVRKLVGAGFKVTKTRPIRSFDIGNRETLWNGNILASRHGAKAVKSRF